jgi:hypothetical protein
MEGTSSSAANKTNPSVARIMVGITLVLWLLVCFLAKTVGKDWRLALLPLYGLYPGLGDSGDTNATWMHAWAIGMGGVFAALALLGILRKNTSAAGAFLLLLILSTLLGFLRILNEVSHLR